MNLSLITDRYRRWMLERAIKRAELALERATPKQHGPAWERTARLILKRDNLDPIVRRRLEAIVARRHG